MNDIEVKQVVNETINQLLNGNMIKYSDLVIYERISDMLREHYKVHNDDIARALEQLRDHPYYNILELYYKDNLTLEQVAEKCNCDLTTVHRNKKSLCIKIFRLIS